MCHLAVARVSSSIQFVAISLQNDDWQHVEPKLAEKNDNVIRVNIPRRRFPNDRSRKVCVLVHDDFVVGLCIAHYRSQSGDVDYMAGIEYLRPLQPATKVGRFVREMPNEVQDAVSISLREGRPLDLLESSEVETTLRSDVLNAATLEFLVSRLHAAPDTSSHSARIQAEQRDALALALEVAGMPSKETLRPVDQIALDGELGKTPFIHSVRDERCGERAVIRYDAKVFDGWDQVEGPEVHFDTVTFADPKSGKEKITVRYVDSERLERITGTDLIYHRSGQPGFAMVQYKQMTREGTKEVYRPDEQLEKEISRMRDITPATEQWFSSFHDYRLSTEAFYMKLVTSDVRRPGNNKLADGMYFPLSMFELMLKDPSLRGKRDGRVITPQNSPKHVSNDLFVELLQGGWIGTVGEGTNHLNQMVIARVAEKRGVIVAEHHAESKALTRAPRF